MEDSVGKEILSAYRVPRFCYLLVFQAMFTRIPSRFPPHMSKTLEEAQGCSIRG